MATPLEKVKSLMIEGNLSYFSVTHNASTLYQQTEELTATESAAKLCDFVEGLDYPYIDVKLSDKSPGDKSKGGRFVNLTHRIKLVDAPGKSEAGSGAGTISLLREIAELKTQIVENKYNALIKELNDKIDDIKENNKNPMQDAALQMLMNMFAGQTPIAAPSAPALAGHETAPDTVKSEQTRIKEALKKIRSADRNYIDTLEMIAQLAETKPQVYRNSLPLLKSQL